MPTINPLIRKGREDVVKSRLRPSCRVARKSAAYA